MATHKKYLKAIRESAEADLPTSASDASAETPKSLSSGVGARSVKAELDAEKAAEASKPVAEEDEMDSEKKAVAESDDADADDAKLAEEDEMDSEKKAVAESDDAETDAVKKAVAEEDKLSDDEVKLSEEDEEALKKADDADVKEATDAISKNEDLPESFKAKVAAIFEAAVKRTASRRTEAYKSKLAEAYTTKLANTKNELSESLVNKVDGYLDYVVEEWMKDNEVAIESSLRSTVTEKFISGLKNLFESHYIEVPAEKANLISEQENKIASLEKELNDQLVKGVELRKENIQLKKANIIKKHTEGLTVSDASKFAELCEGVSFENAKTFGQKLQVIKETYFPKSPKKSGDLDASLLTEGGIEHVESAPTTEVDVYADAISRMLKR